jgi:hypothetical protein
MTKVFARWGDEDLSDLRKAKARLGPVRGRTKNDHYAMCIVILRLDKKHLRSKAAISRALAKTTEYEHIANEKWMSKRVSEAFKFAKLNVRSHPELQPLVDILSRLPQKHTR